MKIRRLLWLPAFISFLAVLHASVAAASYDGSLSRIVNVCVLNDKEEPASEEIIRQVTANVFLEYEEQIGVRFVTEAFITAEVNLDIWPPFGLGFEVKNVCPENTETRMIFSNRRMGFINSENKVVEIGGLSDDYYGLVAIFYVGGRMSFKDGGGNPAVETTLKHEIGHLFKLDHTDDKNSFMYSPSNTSTGKWTDEILKKLFKNRNKKWR